MVIKEIDNLTTQEALHFYIEYLKVLQEGRCKPDTNNCGYVRESMENAPTIKEVRSKINTILDVKIPDNIDVTFDKTKKAYKY